MSSTLPQPAPRGAAETPSEPADRVSGPAFPPAVKVLATALTVASLAGGAMALSAAATAAARPAASVIAVLGVLAVIVVGCWGILTGRTSCSDACIEQTWPWRRTVRIADITSVAMVRVRGLEWLVVPRLVVRTRHGLTTFHTADPAVLARLEALVARAQGRSRAGR